jgi:uncharacterized protein (UPF0261 family)
MVHNAQMTCFAPTPEEMVAAAQEMIERLNRACGPVIVVLPAKGFSRPNQEGMPLFVPEGNQAVIDEFQSALRPEVPLIVTNLHINDSEFADLVAGCMQGLLQGQPPQEVAASSGWH